jgi:hypothetical protein
MSRGSGRAQRAAAMIRAPAQTTTRLRPRRAAAARSELNRGLSVQRLTQIKPPGAPALSVGNTPA